MKRIFRDHLGREVAIAFPPRRIISLCPSLTETLFALGLEDEIVGRTSYCVHPAECVSAVPTVGGTKDVTIQAVLDLRPDVVIAGKEENRKEVVEALAAATAVYVTDVRSHGHALQAIRDLGAVTDRAQPAKALTAEIEARFARLPRGRKITAVYLVWRQPYMAVGRDTYIHSLLEICGLHNVCVTLPERYPAVTLADLQALSPELLLLSSEPFPFDHTHAAELARHLPRSRVMLVDGEMFSWYGSRMILAAEYLTRFLDEIAE